MRRLVFWWSFCSSRCGSAGMRFGATHPARDAPRFCDFRRPKLPPPSPYKLRGVPAWPSEQSDFLRRPTKEFKKQLGSAVSHHQRHLSAIRWNRNCRGAARNLSVPKNDSRPAPSKSGGNLPSRASPAGPVRVPGQPGQGFADVRSRARRGGDGSRRCEGTRPARPVAEKCGPSDGRRLAGGDAGFGEPWRRMTNASSGFARGNRQPGTNARLGRQRTRS